MKLVMENEISEDILCKIMQIDYQIYKKLRR